MPDLLTTLGLAVLAAFGAGFLGLAFRWLKRPGATGRGSPVPSTLKLRLGAHEFEASTVWFGGFAIIGVLVVAALITILVGNAVEQRLAKAVRECQHEADRTLLESQQKAERCKTDVSALLSTVESKAIAELRSATPDRDTVRGIVEQLERQAQEVQRSCR